MNLRIFKKNLILVSEMGGTYDVLNDRDDTIGITTWFNERYVKDCSRKTRDHMYSKQKTGRLIMGNYYGYIKDPEDITGTLRTHKKKTVSIRGKINKASRGRAFCI